MSHQEIAALFPETMGGGTRSRWGIRSEQGLTLELAEAVTFFSGHVGSGFDTLDPPELLTLPEGSIVTTDWIAFYQSSLRQSETQEYTWYSSGHVAVDLDRGTSSREVSWSVSVSMNLFCEYENTAGEIVATLTGASIGIGAQTHMEHGTIIPGDVAVAQSSWGPVKQAYNSP